MKNTLLDSQNIQQVNSEFEKCVNTFAQDLMNDFEDLLVDSTPLSLNFINQFKKIKSYFSGDLPTSEVHFYWYNWVDKTFYIGETLIAYTHTEDKEEKDELEIEMFEFWNESEFAESFAENYEDSKDIVNETINLLPMLENQILSFFFLHLYEDYTGNKYEMSFPDFSLSYQANIEFGDNTNALYFPSKNKKILISKQSENFPFFTVQNFDYQEHVVTITEEDRIIDVPLINHPYNLKCENLSISFYPNFSTIHQEELTLTKIEKAINRIENISPDLKLLLFTFTNAIIPIDTSGVVSYSTRELPGYSMINFNERDELDLLDDLLHENGHHYLNQILEAKDLIIEDDEQIYYSPWRENYRPVRGLYHATFTFYWALHLYHSLALEEFKTKTEQQEKVFFRFCEEFMMLEFTYRDINHAFDNKKITEEGNQLINNVYDLVFSKRDDYNKVKESVRELYPNSFNELDKLTKTLAQIHISQ